MSTGKIVKVEKPKDIRNVNSLGVYVVDHDSFDTRNMIDDIWIKVFYHLNVSNFLAVHLTCQHFHDITKMNTDNKYCHQINKYWKLQCTNLCTDIETSTYDCSNWHKFYQPLLSFMLSLDIVLSMPMVVSIKYHCITLQMIQ